MWRFSPLGSKTCLPSYCWKFKSIMVNMHHNPSVNGSPVCCLWVSIVKCTVLFPKCPPLSESGVPQNQPDTTCRSNRMDGCFNNGWIMEDPTVAVSEKNIQYNLVYIINACHMTIRHLSFCLNLDCCAQINAFLGYLASYVSLFHWTCASCITAKREHPYRFGDWSLDTAFQGLNSGLLQYLRSSSRARRVSSSACFWYSSSVSRRRGSGFQ